MPSALHDDLVELFRNRPRLAAELIRHVLKVTLPPFAEISIESADLTNVQPPEYRADLAVSLHDNQTAVLGIIVEVQLSRDKTKRFSWPAYVTNFRCRLGCPVLLLVFCMDEGVTQWCRKEIDLGGGNLFRPLVLGSSQVPQIINNDIAQTDPELAVLSAMAHGDNPDPHRAIQIATTALDAISRLDTDSSVLYADLVLNALGNAARQEFAKMDPAKYEFKSEFARHYLAQGRQEGVEVGERHGQLRTLSRLLQQKFQLDGLPQSIQSRLEAASSEELDRWTEQILGAETIEDVLQ